MIVRKVFNQWVYNEQEIVEVLEQNGIEENNRTIVDYLFECAINNEKFREDVLKHMSEYGSFVLFIYMVVIL